jgi:hypothetical protein
VGIDVVAADGRRWTVERRFRWPKWRHLGRNLDDDAFLDLGSLFGDFTPLGLIAGLLLALVLGLVIVVVLPLLLLVAEIALALAAVLFFRGTWIVEATTSGKPPERKAWTVRGPRRSKRAVDEVASELRAGLEAAPTGSDPAPNA